jgi:hypothetical protein
MTRLMLLALLVIGILLIVALVVEWIHRQNVIDSTNHRYPLKLAARLVIHGRGAGVVLGINSVMGAIHQFLILHQYSNHLGKRGDFAILHADDRQ